MPVCNKCKKHSNCLTIDPCDHCGAKDWDETTVLASSGKPKTYGLKLGDALGRLSGLVLVATIGFGVYYFFFMSDTDRLSGKYNVPIERVDAPPKPHGCDFDDAPLGNKHCHYEKHVYVYDKNLQVIEIDGTPHTCPTGCGTAYSVVQLFEKVED